MPQRVVVKSIVTKPTKKEGTNITTIEDEKGARMSAFNDTALAQVHAGDILEVEVAVEGKYTNITGWKLIESKPQPEPLPPLEIKPPYKDNSASIEAQTAYKGIMEVWASGQEVTERLKDAATRWALLKLDWKVPEKEAGKPSDKAQNKGLIQPEDKKATVSPTESQAGTLPEFKDGTDLVNYALKHGFKLVNIKETLGIKTPADIKDVAVAAKTLFVKGVK